MVGLQSKDLAHFHHGRKEDSMQAHIVLEGLRALYSDPQAAARESNTGLGLGF